MMQQRRCDDATVRKAMAWAALLTFGLSTTSALAENWPGWRGPRGDGTSLETQVPIHWDGTTGEKVVWKTAVPGIGHASPIVWDDRVFVVSCVVETAERILCCFDRSTGELRWQVTVIESPLETKHALNSHASSTPVTDGERVIVSFLETDGSVVPAKNVSDAREITAGRMVVAAYDLNGNLLWLVRPGDFASAHGYCSSPIIYGDLVIVNGDHDGDSYVVALNKTDGQIAWKVPRDHKTRSYVTPLVRTVNGRTQMVFSGSKHVVSLDPGSGRELWRVEGPTEQFVASLVDDEDSFYLTAGFPTYHVLRIMADGEGDVTESHVAWHVTTARCYVPSPVRVDDYLLIADDRGTANCFDTKTGERHWQERLGNHFSASLVTAQGLVFFLADEGTTKVVRPGKELEIVSENQLGEACYASPAISNGQLFIRGERHLYCIGN